MSMVARPSLGRRSRGQRENKPKKLDGVKVGRRGRILLVVNGESIRDKEKLQELLHRLV